MRARAGYQKEGGRVRLRTRTVGMGFNDVKRPGAELSIWNVEHGKGGPLGI